MFKCKYSPRLLLRNGITITSDFGRYCWFSFSNWQNVITEPESAYHEVILSGFQDVPIFGSVAIPSTAHSTIVTTYSIT